jgi:hypothetical protein
MQCCDSGQTFHHILQDTFIKSLAFVLGINPARIRVANVISGRRRQLLQTPQASTTAAAAGGAALVSVEIGEDPAPKPEAPFNMTYNLDMDTSLQVAQQVRLRNHSSRVCVCVYVAILI